MPTSIRALYYSFLIFICAPSGSQADSNVTDLSEKLLNSERIADRFGSYSIEVISQNDDHRISNLYSEDKGVKTTRTLAVVDFLSPVNPHIAELHESVLEGASLGATFKSNGWKVSKINVAVETVSVDQSSKKVRSWMKLVGHHELAMHVYLLRLSQHLSEQQVADQKNLEDTEDYEHIDYAIIAELHHPEYLDIDSLKKIHGETARLHHVTELLTNSIRSTLINFIKE